MQDKAIAAIGQWQLENKQDLAPVDLYIENMFSGKDYQILLLVFEITKDGDTLKCHLKDDIDIEKVGKDTEVYKKFAYRKGSGKGGDFTFTTKVTAPSKGNSNPVEKKLKVIEKLMKELSECNITNEAKYFSLAYNELKEKKISIKETIRSLLDKNQWGLSVKFVINGEEKYPYDFNCIKESIIKKFELSKTKNESITSKSKHKVSSLTGKIEENIYGFGAPFPIATPDKKGFISGFFDKKQNWRNYPLSDKDALLLELGAKFIENNLKSRFYSFDYLLIPNTISGTENLRKIVTRLKTALIEEASKERKKRNEEAIMKLIGNESNYFYIDIVFFKREQSSMKILLDLEEQLPSRFRTLFIDVPEKINKYKIFKNAITIKKEQQDLHFSFGIIKEFFDTEFLDVVNKLFKGERISEKYLFEKIMYVIRKNYNESKTSDKWVEPTDWTVKKAIMLIHYLQNLGIINYNKNYKYMETTNVTHQTSFNLEEFENFVKENQDFLDSEIKVGIFAVGVLVRFLFDIQNANLHNTPFESKLRGYKLNADLLMNVYTEALDKIQKYQNFYTYLELRDIISKNFTTHIKELNKLTNNEISFYFVAGLEMGKQFKHEKEDN